MMNCKQISYNKGVNRLLQKNVHIIRQVFERAIFLGALSGSVIHMRCSLNEKNLYVRKYTPLERDFDLETTNAGG